MLKQIEETIRRRHLFEGVRGVLAGVSGGADSVAMAYALHSLRKRHSFRLVLAHLNHGLRGRESEADEQFVCALAWKLGCEAIVESAEVSALARREGMSIEMAARKARYEFFQRAGAAAGAEAIATAHTADDQAETVLLKLARGAGAQGLSGIAYASRLGAFRLARPLRDVTHADACAFLRRHGLAWREDASNRRLDVLRNRVRHVVLPLLEEQLNPGIRQALVRMADVLHAENAWLDELAKEHLAPRLAGGEPAALNLVGWEDLPLACRRRLIRLWLAGAGVDPLALDFNAIERIERLAETARSGGVIPLAGGWRVRRTRERLLLERGAAPVLDASFCAKLRIPGVTWLPEAGLSVAVEKKTGFERTKALGIGLLPAEVALSAAAVGRSPVYIRSWRPGDRIRPLGLAGSQKVQDLFTDAKVPAERRAGIPLLECRGEVVWVAGHRVARGWEVPGPEGQSLRFVVERALPGDYPAGQ